MSKAELLLAQILLNSHEKIYTYHLFTLFDSYFIKKILLISFWNRDTDIIKLEKRFEDILI